MTNIVKDVYKALAADTEEIAKEVRDLDALETEIRNERYSQRALREEIYPRRDTLREELAQHCEAALNRSRGLVAQYRAEAAELDNLNPDDLTDDLKLLQSGVPLLPRDVQAILKRSAGNRTMTQLALRYAEDHGIDVGGTVYVGGEAERQTADGLDTIISIYKGWIDKPNAMEMLNQFFSC